MEIIAKRMLDNDDSDDKTMFDRIIIFKRKALYEYMDFYFSQMCIDTMMGIPMVKAKSEMMHLMKGYSIRWMNFMKEIHLIIRTAKSMGMPTEINEDTMDDVQNALFDAIDELLENPNKLRTIRLYRDGIHKVINFEHLQ